MRSRMNVRAIPLAAAIIGILFVAGDAPAQETTPVKFVYAVKQDENPAPDAELRKYLLRKTSSHIPRFDTGRRFAYHEVIDDVLRYSEDGTPFVARLTPYAYVAAQLQGAEFDVLATYISKATGTDTYHSYLIVRAVNDGFTFPAEPTPRDVIDYISQKGVSPRRFVYHDRFSTSSYFVPSMYFRSKGIFHMPEGAVGGLIPIKVENELTGKKSSDLMMMVARGEADIAAVWDGTIKSFEAKHPAEAKTLRWVQLPALLPNDLFVSSKNLTPAQKEKLKAAFSGGDGIQCPKGQPEFGEDFDCWTDINEVAEASKALADLRREAVAPPAPVAVRVSLVPQKGRKKDDPEVQKLHQSYVAAAENAIRFAGTEFKVHERFDTQTPDVEWRIEPVHDGAIVLGSVMGETVKGVDAQFLRISFTDVKEDLPKRIETLIHTRLNRIRYIWPYSASRPLILRDVGFSIPKDTVLRAQHITWTDPVKNEFVSAATEYDLRVVAPDSYKFVLDGSALVAAPKLDPMSNTAYRVVLVRHDPSRPLFRNLTLALVILMAAAAAAAIYDWIRERRAARPRINVPGSPALHPAE